ncbi:FkbM family methyltransferase [Spectribacter hydrogenoxidans]|uniref:FkbM family methyltransferase n=1 Tax=Spectribacter hydrogenoxidans TaxID=3075608 RepID=A0ABU3C4C7_9GAMM|nr:FkbM family methyltransferase [Salinisphaera sp. W335]MDT0636367.1 FkbM family methyltransferase [Salinisphaera sp. W335]
MLNPSGKLVGLEDVNFRVGVATLGAYRRAIEFKYREGRFTTEFLKEARTARVVYDVGAHVGFYALLAAKANSDASVIAFEPQHANFLELEKNIERNDVKGVIGFPYGVSDKARTAQLAVAVSGNCAGGGTHHVSASGSGEQIRTVVLDEFVREWNLPSPSMVLIDIEGHELAALRGMERTLREHQPSLYIEVHRRQLQERGESHEQLDEFLNQFGYVAEILRNPSGQRGTHTQLHVRYRATKQVSA